MLQNIQDIIAQFPILGERVNGHRFVYLDNAATTQKPRRVLDSLLDVYERHNGNVHRGVHSMSNSATRMFEGSRGIVAQFIGSAPEEVIFTRGTTESINLVASTYGMEHVGKGDEVIVSLMEHHSNFVPWQQLCERRGATLRVVPLTIDGSIDYEAYKSMLTPRTKVVAIAHAGNVTGVINPVREIISEAHKAGAKVLIDAAQSVPHIAIDVKDLDCDFLVFSGHKIYAPTGIGVLYGKREILDAMPPYQYGGEMIRKVRIESTSFNDVPYRFEAGTPDYAGAIALGEALRFVSEIGLDAIARHEQELTRYALDALSAIEGLHIIGGANAARTSVISFVIDDVHPYDLGMLIDHFGVAVRTGHHCAEPLIDSLGLLGTVRASFAVYNTQDDIQQLVKAINKVLPMLR